MYTCSKFQKRIYQIQKYGKKFIKVRIISSKNLLPPQEVLEKLVIHIHGGGFIGMSSRSHQIYTREWSNTLDCPIFSIDYRKAPQHPYPAGIDDIWQAYNWILQNVKRLFGVTPKKIVVTGDSAGGNLAVGLITLCIRYGQRLPDGLVLSYPALNLDNNRYTPSYLFSIDDTILPTSFLKGCSFAYLQEYDEQREIYVHKDPLISPSNLTDEMLLYFPPLRILVGSDDPFADDCTIFASRFRNLEKDIKLIIFQNMRHGYLQYNNMVPNSNQCVKETCFLIQELFNQKTENI